MFSTNVQVKGSYENKNKTTGRKCGDKAKVDVVSECGRSFSIEVSHKCRGERMKPARERAGAAVSVCEE